MAKENQAHFTQLSVLHRVTHHKDEIKLRQNSISDQIYTFGKHEWSV